MTTQDPAAGLNERPDVDDETFIRARTPGGRPMKFHHLRQQPISGLNQWFRLYRPFTGRGIGVVVWRHEFSVTLP